MAKQVKVQLPDGQIGTIPEENLEQAKKRGAVLVEPKKSLPEKAVDTGKGIVDSVLEGAEDLGRGVLEGATFGGSGEIMGGVTALGALATGQAKSTDELVELYKKYRDIEEAKLKASKERSPYLAGGGEIAGTIGGALLTGGVALEGAIAGKLGSLGVKEAIKRGGGKLLSKEVGKEVAKQGAASAVAAVPYGAVQGALEGEGKLIGATPEERELLASDAVSGGLSGGLVGGALGLGLAGGKAAVEVGSELGKSLKNKMAMSKTDPNQRQIVKAYEMGEQGVNPRNQTDFLGSNDIPGSFDKALSAKPAKEASGLVDVYLSGDKQLGDEVGKVVDGYVDELGNSKPLSVDNTVKQKVTDFIKYSDKDPSIGLNDNAKRVFEQLQNLSEIKPTARMVMNARDDLYRFAEAFKVKDPFIAGEARDLANKLGRDMKAQIPGYKEAAERLKNFRNLFGESVLSGDVPLDYFSGKISRTKEAESKLLQNFRDMIKNVGAPGEAGRGGQEAFTNLMKNLQDLQKKDPKIFEKIGINPENIEKVIKNASDEFSAVSLMRGYEPRSSALTEVKGGLINSLATTGKGTVLHTARYAGRLNAGIDKLSKSIGKMTDDNLMKLSVKLPDALRKSLIMSIKNKDIAGKNAVLFSLMQNPEYRKLVEAEDIIGDDEDGR